MAAGPLRPDDPKLGEFIEPIDADASLERLGEFNVILVGFPHDEGVRANGGRVGAADAPACVFNFIKRLGTAVNPEFGGVDLKQIRIGNIGLVAVDKPLAEAHRALQDVVRRIRAANAIPFVIGGGNDQSYPNAAGWLDAHRSSATDETKPFCVVNVDAHLDVRPLLEGNRPHSGSPFRQLLEDSRFKASGGDCFCVFGAQGHQCSAEHAEWMTQRGGQICWLSSVHDSTDAEPGRCSVRGIRTQAGDVFERTVFNGSRVFLSFDLDSVVGSDAPGVSCPSTIGLTAAEALDICFRAGFSGLTDLVDVSECNPVIENYRTPRLVALMFYYFVLGMAKAR